jgi:hypothetical protein
MSKRSRYKDLSVEAERLGELLRTASERLTEFSKMLSNEIIADREDSSMALEKKK